MGGLCSRSSNVDNEPSNANGHGNYHQSVVHSNLTPPLVGESMEKHLQEPRRAGSVGLGKAVEVLDTLGSSMTNLNPGSGFASGVGTKGNDISILPFEIANTIVKGSNLMQSLSNRSMRNLKEVVLPSEGVQHLVSKDMDELLRIVAADKRKELKIFFGEVVRFRNRSKDPQWHNLDRYFEKISRELTPQKQLKE